LFFIHNCPYTPFDPRVNKAASPNCRQAVEQNETLARVRTRSSLEKKIAAERLLNNKPMNANIEQAMRMA
jgi:hypothetical protein